MEIKEDRESTESRDIKHRVKSQESRVRIEDLGFRCEDQEKHGNQGRQGKHGPILEILEVSLLSVKSLLSLLSLFLKVLVLIKYRREKR